MNIVKKSLITAVVSRSNKKKEIFCCSSFGFLCCNISALRNTYLKSAVMIKYTRMASLFSSRNNNFEQVGFYLAVPSGCKKQFSHQSGNNTVKYNYDVCNSHLG